VRHLGEHPDVLDLVRPTAPLAATLARSMRSRCWDTVNSRPCGSTRDLLGVM
jgi:hypothetical protein